MRVTGIQLKNFKRFTDLTIKNIPETAKLVLVVGPNGSGKSSLFDALFHWYRIKADLGFNTDHLYLRKDADQPFEWNESVIVTVAGGKKPVRGSLYVRSAYRNDPDFQVTGIARSEPPTESVRFNRFIDNDATVSHNYQRLVHDTMSAVYDDTKDSMTVAALREELIGEVRASMKAVFLDLTLSNIADPLGSGAFYFSKGTAKSYHYKNLSGGEKAAFDLLLDLHIKKKYFQDAIYCIDEMETHLHTRVQGRLLQEMTKILPGESQLWVTTHSLGMMRAAQEMSVAHPGSVCLIDFDGIDPDEPRELQPSSIGRVSWEKMLSVALDDLSPRVFPSVLILCEGSSLGKRRKNFDAEIYNRILGQNISHVLFISGGSSNQLSKNGIGLTETLSALVPSTTVLTLRDRDDLSDQEVKKIEVGGNLVLKRRNLESYLFADDIIESLAAMAGHPQLAKQALEIKSIAIARSVGRSNPADDLKSAAGEIYVGLKTLLSLTRCGNDTDSFMEDTLAPLVTPSMQTFTELYADIVDRLPKYNLGNARVDHLAYP